MNHTLSKLSNKQYINLRGDRTFRFASEELVLLTVGALTKHCSVSDPVYAFRALCYACPNLPAFSLTARGLTCMGVVYEAPEGASNFGATEAFTRPEN